jgi:hypothetical protein
MSDVLDDPTAPHPALHATLSPEGRGDPTATSVLAFPSTLWGEGALRSKAGEGP